MTIKTACFRLGQRAMGLQAAMGRRRHCMEDMVIKQLLGAVTVAGLIAACGGSGPAPDRVHAPRPPKFATAARAGLPSGCLVPPATCYAPRVFRTAYGISPLLDRGIDGRGQTVVMPEVAQQPGPDASDIRQDMARFDSLFGLPQPRLRVVNSLAHSASPWLAGGEEAEDTEMVHAVAPGAAISIVLVKPSAVNSAADFAAALTAFLRLGATSGGVLSISASIGEHYLTPAEVAGVDAALRADRDHHVTVVAASGDKGAASDLHFGSATPVKEVSLPASDPLVLAVGGTSLAADRATGAYIGETAWNTVPAPPSPGDGSSASGGGFSHLFARPGYQDGIPGTGATRGVPDVAGDAAFNTGMAVVDGAGIVRPATGTSAAAPFWAGLLALADQLAHRHLGFINPAIYRIAHGPDYRAAFHDITRGDNTFVFPPTTITGYQASSGWDRVTGWGTSDAAVLVPLLAHR
jgi:subtilase family serine protease